MSEEKTPSVETEVETVEKNEATSPDVGLVAESKKYRLRAQDAEKERDALKAKIEEIDNLKLKENEEFKTLSEKQESVISELKGYKEKYLDIEKSTKEELLLKLPEDRRDDFKDESVKTLRGIVGMLDESKPLEAPPARGSVGNQPPPKHWTEYEGDEAKQAYEAHLNNIIKR